MAMTPQNNNTPRPSAEENSLQAAYDAEETIIMDAVHPEGEPEYENNVTPSDDAFLGEVPADSVDEEEIGEPDKRDNTVAMIIAGAIGAIVVITLIFFLVGRSPDKEPDTTATSSTAASTLPAPTDSNKGFTLPEVQPGDGVEDVNQPAPRPTTHVVTTVVDAPEPAITPVEQVPAAIEDGPGNYMALNQAPENVQKVGRILQSEIFTSTTMDRAEYDRLADATQPLGFTPDQSFYTAFENLGYLGDAGDLTYASVAENPNVRDNLNGTYTMTFMVTATVMLNEVLDNMGWNQDSLQKDLRKQLTDRENYRSVTVTLDANAGTMSTSSTTWWL